MIHLILIPILVWNTGVALQPEQTAKKPDDDLTGIWELIETTGETLPGRQIKMYTEDYFTFARFGEEPARFYASGGGFYTMNNGNYTETFEFFTEDPAMVNDSLSYTMKRIGNRITLTSPDGQKEIWEQVSEEKTVMTGVWQITKRMRPGEDTMNPIPDGARKTIKVLSGNRFHWAAINTETGEFFGTGGGIFESDNDSYTEQIQFFSRDDTKAGIALTFQKELKNSGKQWHHIGHGTTGKPVNEVWEKVEN